MKKFKTIAFFVLTIFFANIAIVNAYVSVQGYYRSNGTYVAPHVRSNPNGLKYDNYSYTPSQGLYNSTYGTRGDYWDTPTYITDDDYYVGKAIYDQNQAGVTSTSPASSTISSSQKLPKKNVSYVTKTWVENNPITSCSQSTFLRVNERIECESYKSQKNNYIWNVTTDEFDGKHYIYDPETKITSSCPDGYSINYDTSTKKPLASCSVETNSQQAIPKGCISNTGFSPLTGESCSVNQTLPNGCTSRTGYSPLTGESCSKLNNRCAQGMFWNGQMCSN